MVSPLIFQNIFCASLYVAESEQRKQSNSADLGTLCKKTGLDYSCHKRHLKGGKEGWRLF